MQEDEESGVSESIDLHRVGGNMRIEVNNGVTPMVGQTVTFSAGQTLTITPNPRTGVDGCTEARESGR